MSWGYRRLEDVPDEKLSNPMHIEMKKMALGAPRYLDPRLLSFLSSEPFPRVFLDFETISNPVPLWLGTTPGETVVFQYSIHIWENFDGPIKHYEFIGEDHHDPRFQIAQNLSSILQDHGKIYAWNGNGTESALTESLIRFLPKSEDLFRSIVESCRRNDPIEKFRDWFYDKNMNGNWGLKSVSRSVLGVDPYSTLAIRNGVDAMRSYEKFIKMEDGEARQTLKKDLLIYCAMDTSVMIDLWKALLD